MALNNTVNPQDASQHLARWLADRLDNVEDVRVDNVYVPHSNGLSTETVIFQATWRQHGTTTTQAMVARVQPAGAGVFPRYDLAKEATIMRALADHTAVPVPKVLFYEPETSVLGSPFLVMAHVEGQVPADDPPFTAQGWVLDLTAEQRRAMWDNGIQVLVDIHSVDVDALNLGFLRDPEHAPGLQGQLDRWESMFRWAAEGQPNPTLEATFSWLRDNAPSSQGKTVVLNWGDARPGNIMYAPDQSVAAVLDFELAALGSREFEIGWWLFLMRHHTAGIGLPHPSGIPDAEATVAQYEKVSGHRLEDLPYHEIFAGARAATCMARAAQMMAASGLLPPENTMATNNPATRLLTELLSLPAPAGQSVSFIGNR